MRIIEVIGKIWMPVKTCAMVYNLLTANDIENIGELTRENVSNWLDTNSGDFQYIIDFHASIDDFDFPWEKEESESIFHDCINGFYEEEE